MMLTIEAYAKVMAELGRAGEERAEVLARHGLDEARWEAIDARWQDEISRALDEEGEGVAEIVSVYAAAYEAAQRALAPPISLERFAEVTRLLQASGDLRASLSKASITLADYARAAEHWSPRLATEPETERRFDDIVRGA